MKERFGLVLVFLLVIHLASWGQHTKPTIPATRKAGVKTDRLQATARSRDAAQLGDASAGSLQLVASAVSGGAIRLYWNDLANESAFVISRSAAPASGFELLAEVAANITSYTDDNLQPGLYYYRISATVTGMPAIAGNTAYVALSITPLVMAEGEVTTCNKVFLDPGGFGDYTYNEEKTLVIKPSEAGKKVRVKFQDFVLIPGDESFFGDEDKLEIFDGADTLAPSLGSYTGGVLPPVLNATNAAGVLTFRFKSGSYDEGRGWQAQLFCATVPTGLQATVAGAQVNLTWRDNLPDETGYRVERRAVGAADFVPLNPPLAPNVTAFSDPGLPADNRYEYRVRALGTQPSYPVHSNTVSVPIGRDPFVMHAGEVSICDRPFLDPGGNGPYPIGSGEDLWSTVTTVLAPSTPGAKVSLDLSEFDMEDGYDFLTVYDGANDRAPTLGDFTGSFLPPRLTATNPAGKLTLVFWTDYSFAYSGWRGEVTCPTAPAAPDNLAAQAVGDTHIRLTWTDQATDETGYVIERTTGTQFAVVATPGLDVQTYDDTDAPAGKTYTYRIRSIRDYVVSNYSNTATATLGNPPLRIQNGTFTACNTILTDPCGDDDCRADGTFTMTLTPETPGQKVSLQFRTLSLDNRDFVQVFDGTTTQAPLVGTYMQEMLPPDMIATNPDGILTVVYGSDGINPSSGWEALVSCITVPAAPSNLQVTLVGVETHLTWEDNSTDETGFIIERATGSEFAKVDIIAAGRTSYTDTDLPADRTLTYRVKALRDNTPSAPGNTATVINGAPPIVMHDGVITACHGLVLDPGVDQPYGNEAMALTIHPDTPDKKVVITFTEINLGSSTTLRVYNGIEISQNELWNWHYWDTGLPGGIQSIHPNGQLTVFFRPYVADERGKGWAARISCVDKGPVALVFDDRMVTYVHPDDGELWVSASALAPFYTYVPTLSYSVVDDLSSTGAAILTPTANGFGAYVNATRAGTIKIKAVVAENEYFTASEKVMTLTVRKGKRRINFNPQAMLMTDAPRTLAATIGVSNHSRPDDFHFEVLPPLSDYYQGRAVLEGALLTPTYPGYVRIKAALAATDVYQADEATVTLELRRASTSVQFADLAMSAAGPPADLAARAYEGGAIFYGITGANTGSVTLSGLRNQTATPITAGTVTVTAFVPESKYYNYAEKQVTLTVVGSDKLAQTIDFGLAETVYATASTFMLEASATSGLPVTFRILSGPATLSGRQIVLTGAEGVVQIEASQPGNDLYRQAATIVRSLTVERSGTQGGDGAVTGADDPVAHSVRLSPNPASSMVTIESPQFTMAKISVTDLLGRSTDHAVDHRHDHQLDTGSLGQGVYILTICLDNGVTLFKRLVIH